MSFGKKDIIYNISSKAHISLDSSSQLLSYFLNLIKQSKSKSIKISNFGTFKYVGTPQRIGRNPKTKEEFIITKRNKMSFKPSKKLRNFIN
jgi:integration host factor subunit alpha